MKMEGEMEWGPQGALFIDTGNVPLHNVNFSNCSALAGKGGGTTGSGGSGGGNGGNRYEKNLFI